MYDDEDDDEMQEIKSIYSIFIKHIEERTKIYINIYKSIAGNEGKSER